MQCWFSTMLNWVPRLLPQSFCLVTLAPLQKVVSAFHRWGICSRRFLQRPSFPEVFITDKVFLLYMYIFVCMHAHKRVRMQCVPERSRGQHYAPPLIAHAWFFWDRVSQSTWSLLIQFDWQANLRDPPVFAFPVLALQTQAAMPVESNSGPQARTASTTMSMPFPQSLPWSISFSNLNPDLVCVGRC